jgi:hypothetical protein
MPCECETAKKMYLLNDCCLLFERDGLESVICHKECRAV